MRVSYSADRLTFVKCAKITLYVNLVRKRFLGNEQFQYWVQSVDLVSA